MAIHTQIKTAPGKPQPFGPSLADGGFNFAVFSKHAVAISLCFFDQDSDTPFHEILLDKKVNKTGDVWHILVFGLPDEILYMFRAYGPHDSHHQHSFNSKKFLLDPYAKIIHSTNKWGDPDSRHYHPLGGFIANDPFDWENDTPPSIPKQDLVIYEMHIRGFTRHPSGGVSHPGTFLGVIEKIPHLLELGVNAVELLPVFEFNEQEYHKINPANKTRLYNFWGYSTVNFFSPMNRYAFNSELGSAVKEFKTMCKELHRHGIEVILDVVFNHTAEGNANGPIYSFKGLDNSIYYLLDGSGHYLNFSGCGNTFNYNYPVVSELILDSLRYWATEMHVDGFRFDLASVLCRGKQGELLSNPPLIEAISEDPVLAKIKLIAEPWDAAGLYQVGSFPYTGRWSEWNGSYRDILRRFIKGSPNEKGLLATRICGSQDFYHAHSPASSLNFVTAHDGFSLHDLVSYNHKHNIENGENNRDGSDANDSWNSGIEGFTDNQDVLKRRNRQMRNFLTALMISQGIPMLVMGDEYGHTRKGNNNPWCQDNELNWFCWDALEKNKDLFNFCKSLIHLRKSHPLLHRDRFLTENDIEWHGALPHNPDWDSNNLLMAFELKDQEAGHFLFIAFNASASPVKIEFPKYEDKNWHFLFNTSEDPPNDFSKEINEQTKAQDSFEMLPFSSLILKAFPK